MAIDHVAREDSVLVAQLASRYFRPGGVVKGVVRLVSHQEKPGADLEIKHVVLQVHGHVTVDSNLLTLPVVHVDSRPSALQEHAQSEQKPLTNDIKLDTLPDVRKFSGDTGTCIFCSPPSVLLSDVNIAPTPSEVETATAKINEKNHLGCLSKAVQEATAERCTREFAIALPENICPSFCGSSARVFYVVSITAQRAIAGSKPISVHLPFEVYGSEYFFEANTVASASQLAASQSQREEPVAPDNNSVAAKPIKPQKVGGTTRVGRLDQSVSGAPAPVGVRIGSEIAFELRPTLMHGRVETEQMQRAQTSIYTIGKESSHLVRFLLTKQFYQPGDILLGVFDFTRASIPCYKVSVTLCQEETLSSMALDPDRIVQSKVFGTFHEHTLGVVQTNVRFSIPHNALPTIKTDLVRIQWLLQFEFSAGALPPQDGTTAATTQQRQTFQWKVPILVQPAVATERTHLANVPHKLFSGSIRAASLSHAEPS